MTEVTLHHDVPRWASRRRTRLAVAVLLASLVALTVADIWLESHSGLAVGMPMSSDAGKPDLRFGYGTGDLASLFTAYGAGGRRAYAVGLAIDTVYPLALAAATVLLSVRAFAGRARWLWAFPVAFAVLDVIENIGLGIALAVHPRPMAGLVAVLSLVTQVKLLSFPATVALLLASAAVLGGRWLRPSRVAPS